MEIRSTPTVVSGIGLSLFWGWAVVVHSLIRLCVVADRFEEAASAQDAPNDPQHRLGE